MASKTHIFWGGVIVVLVAAGAVLSGVFDPSYSTAAVDKSASSPELLTRGRYLVRAADCTSCHTAANGAPFAGGVPLATPFGRIYGSNITPDKEHGIGKWTSADFYKALHDGLAPDHPLYPAMPYTSYRGVTRADSDAMFAYLQSLKPVSQPDRKNEFSFPFTLRPLMRGWDLLFLKNTLPDASVGDSAEWVRGRYLTNALGHCTECHTPRGAVGQLILGQTLAGGALGDIKAPDVTPKGLAARGWNTHDLQTFLAQGVAAQGSVFSEMYQAFHHSTRYLDAADNKALVMYLTGDSPLAPVPLPATDSQAPVGPGRAHYLALCAGCHAAQGQGKPNISVAMQANTTVRNADPHNLISVMLSGIDAQKFTGTQAMQAMPGFASKLNDRQMAELANYLRVAWGGQKGDVTPAMVANIRK
jgi:mono/diheme cytochrome c family protein